MQPLSSQTFSARDNLPTNEIARLRWVGLGWMIRMISMLYVCMYGCANNGFIIQILENLVSEIYFTFIRTFIY